jgi:hypothetical protein
MRNLEVGMVTTEQVWVDKTLPGFDELLLEWISVLNRLMEEWEEDVDFPWCYNERACVGTFAAAVWLCDGAAFEEYLSEKVKDRAATSKSSESSPGRTDLFFSYNGKEYIVEAKQWWPELESPDLQIDQLASKLELAVGDALAVNEEYGTRLAMVFASPRAPKSRSKDLSSMLKAWIDQVDAEKNDYSARAFFFPESGVNALDEKWIYPGIGLFIKKLTNQ